MANSTRGPQADVRHGRSHVAGDRRPQLTE